MKLSKGVFLLFLGLFFKVAVAGIQANSTQVYWLELEIESSVYNFVVELLKNLPHIDIDNAAVTNIDITTDCPWNGMHKICSCKKNYTGSEDMCKNDKCCNENCTQKVNDIAVCLPESRVSIDGSTKFPNENCSELCDPNKKDSDAYKKKSMAIINKLVEQYSTLKYFDSLIINSYRSGSLIVNYTVQLMSSVTFDELENVTKQLNDSVLVTTGLISINGPQKAIDIGSSTFVNCTPPEELGEVKWFLTDGQNKTTEITSGKEAILKNNKLMDTVELNGISGSWKGTLKCVYTRRSINHIASTELDIALLPEIQAMGKPQFPDCRDPNAKWVVEIECKILDDKENYNVTWNTALAYTNRGSERQGKFLSYKIKADIFCGVKAETENVKCIFTNSRAEKNTNRSQNVQIPIINSHSKFCKEEGDWPITKSNYMAQMPCKGTAVGLTSRNCSNESWEKEIPSCVDAGLHDVQQAVEMLNKGIGFIKNDADILFRQIQHSTTVETFNSFANINTAIVIFQAMNDVSKQQSNQWDDTNMPDFVSSISNALNDTKAWKDPKTENTNLSITYLQTIEEMISNSNLTSNDRHNSNNVKLALCSKTKGEHCGAFNSSVIADNSVVVVGFRNLHEILPQYDKISLETTILSVTTANNISKNNSISVKLAFDYAEKRLRNHEMYCVFWDVNQNAWSSQGCKWGGAQQQTLCTCEHNSAFTILMSKNAETLLYMEELTYVGLGISIVSLVLCLIIEFLVWDAVVKSDITNFRHTALVNISLCMLFAHCGFLASADPKAITPNWCSILTVTNHFFFLAVFFWMLCLSFVLLHQLIFVFDQLRKIVFLVLSITVGYVCPLICVATTYISFENGKDNVYYSTETCWLLYRGKLKGSIFSFVIPALTIVIVNLFTLVVVIMKIVNPTVSESKARDQKDVAKSMIKTIVFLSPVLGITWFLGIFVLYLDLTEKPFAQIVSYAFTLFNSLQGFLILLTNCLGEKKVRDALLKRFKSKQSVQSKTERSTKATSSVMTK